MNIDFNTKTVTVTMPRLKVRPAEGWAVVYRNGDDMDPVLDI